MYFENPHKQIWSKFGCRGLLKYHFGAICKNEQNVWRIVQNTGPHPNPTSTPCFDFCKIVTYLCILRTPINKSGQNLDVGVYKQVKSWFCSKIALILFRQKNSMWGSNDEKSNIFLNDTTNSIWFEFVGTSFVQIVNSVFWSKLSFFDLFPKR